jgi:hypothetical protein
MIEGKYAKKYDIVKGMWENKYNFHRRVWIKMNDDERFAAIRRSLLEGGVSSKDAKAYIKHLQGSNLSHKRKGDINRTAERKRTRLWNIKVVKAGCVAGALGMLANVANAEESLDEEPCVKMRDAMREFIETGDCRVLTRAQLDVDKCALNLVESISTPALTIAAAWQKMGEECDKRKQAETCGGPK